MLKSDIAVRNRVSPSPRRKKKRFQREQPIILGGVVVSRLLTRTVGSVVLFVLRLCSHTSLRFLY